MMVIFISQCEKKALPKTRRVLDAFANRIGNNTWQTVITQEGLNTVRKKLRQTASKSTAVSCHWIRSRSRSQFLWVVGNKSKFNMEGSVPVNTTERNLLNSHIENDWKYLPLIKALTAISALFHDWGKASKLFQEKLLPESKNKFKGDPIRHEWISTLLLTSFIKGSSEQTDENWLNRLAKGEIYGPQLNKLNQVQEDKPLEQLPDTAKLVAWLILSHHKLPFKNEEGDDWRDESAINIDAVLKRITRHWGYENRFDEKEFQKRVKDCFVFPNGFLSQSNEWLKQVKRWSNRLLDCLSLVESAMIDGSYRFVLHHARLCLMLGDHYYSSQKASEKWQDITGLFANTDRKTKALKQKLDEHLCCVAENALKTAHLLPTFEQELPVAQNVQSLGKLSPKTYNWQDKAVKEINDWKKNQGKGVQGFFAVNMASTGCGKTYANAKVMRTLSHDSKSLRYILALGLRTLTLQTGDEYRDRIGLTNEDLAVLIGSKAVADLHNQLKLEACEENIESTGSESEQVLLDEFLDYECDIPVEGLATVLTKEKERKFLYSPVLACTIDHIMSATETKRGGRYILPCLRLMSSDLVIDEIDDFSGSDLIAIGRLIHMAGMLGRKVMISSATIPPGLAEGYFNAYKKGWQCFSNSRDKAVDNIGCAWIDEFKTIVNSINSLNSDNAIASYQQQYNTFINKRVAKLTQQPVKRKADIVQCHDTMEDAECEYEESTKQEMYFAHIKNAIVTKHRQHNTVDKITGVEVSFGVVRMANITPCIALSRYLLQNDFPQDIDVKIMPYHSQQILLLRHEQEKHLDEVLKRKEFDGQQPAAFSKNHLIRSHIDNCKTKNLIFILVATPVEEVGRDHDFDWAVVEPSSYRSIIQLAGRVRRHRNGEIKQSNMALMQYNWKAFKACDQTNEKYFNHPGYEEKEVLTTHNLEQLVDIKLIERRMDAIPRIKRNDILNYRSSLADLEHYAIQSDLTNYQGIGPETLQGYLSGFWYLTALPQMLNSFRKSESTTKVFRAYDSECDKYYFAEKDDSGYPVNRENILNIRLFELTENQKQNIWLHRDYDNLLNKYAARQETDKYWLSLRYGELSFIHRDGQEYEYNDQFGLVKV